MSILDKITEKTREDLIKRRQKFEIGDFRSFEDYEHPRKDLYQALKRENYDNNVVRIIAEIKKASPSKGVIRQDFEPVRHAEQYMENGAAALSVLTDEPFFQGHLTYMRDVSRISDVPVLRKDFIIDFYQIEEARAFGADAILLIATILSAQQLQELHHAATEGGLQCLVECYNEDDFAKISFDQVRILGVNNRNLNTFEVDVHRGVALLQRAPDDVVKVSESGLGTNKDLDFLLNERIDSALIGESFMKSDNPGVALREMLHSKK